MDEHPGSQCIPLVINKYLHGSADPVNHIDPSGHMTGFGFGGGFVDISSARFQAVYNRSNQAKKAYQTHNNIMRNLCKSADSMTKGIKHMHHARPKFMGGPDVSKNIAEIENYFHTRLRALLSPISRVNAMVMRYKNIATIWQI